jgi:translocation and assembly module TamB
LIRLIYWSAILVEFLLLLAVLFIFIVTDARTIKIIAKESLAISHFKYQNIEGNFFTGLKIKGLSYCNKPLFDSATLHWNPLTVLDKKITLQEVEARGVELENILEMISNFQSKSEESFSFNFDFSTVLSNIHLDINPYVFEGVKFSSFLFETDSLNLSKDFLIDSKNLYLRFNSDLVNVKLKGSIEKSRLLIDSILLKNIDSKAITKLVKRIKGKKVKKRAKQKKSEPFIKKIEVKKIIATLKDVNYDPLQIYKTKILVYNGTINPYNSYSYSVKKVKLIGNTNFGKLEYSGYVKDSTIYAKGDLILFKELFSRYDLPLNYKTLRKLPSKLRLNHDGVWIDIEHKSKNLLKIESDFNLDVLDSQHKLHYDYSDNRFTVESNLKGSMPYADTFNIKNRVIIDEEKGFRYLGKIDIPTVKSLPTASIDNLKGVFSGDSSNFDIKLESKFVHGDLVINNYEDAILKLESKQKGIKLTRLIPSLSSLPSLLRQEKVSFSSETFLDFKNFHHSSVVFNIYSNILNINATTALTKPFTSTYSIEIPSYTLLRRFNSNVNFSRLKHLEGKVKIFSNHIDITAKNRYLTVDVEFNHLNKRIQRGFLLLEGHEFRLFSLKRGYWGLKSNISDIQNLLQKLNKYYKIEFPNIQGAVNLEIAEGKNNLFSINLTTPHIKYLSDAKKDKVIANIYDLELELDIDKDKNIEIKKYEFKIDDNEYESRFYATKHSYFIFKDDEVKIKELWINDKIWINGLYEFSTSRGNFYLNSKKFEFKNRDFDFVVDFGLTVDVVQNSIALSGVIDMFGNSISYEMVGSDIVEDSDIIIVKESFTTEESLFNNLMLDLKINTEEPLKYISKDTNIEFFNDLRVIKNEGKDIILTGMSSITKGYYQVEDKKFTLDKSNIYFAGDPKKPLLDIKAQYRKDEYLISIFISGSTEEPIVNFSSEPYLTQQEILSLILFDGTGASNGGGAEAYTLLGGTFAKGLIKSLGIDVDHLFLGTDANDNFAFEIGRKISKNVTVMYQHEDGKDGVKVRVEHNRNFETDIIIQPPKSSSIEFLYKYSQ